MPELSTKPYFLRAVHEWCTDSGYTPLLSVKVDERTKVPLEHVKNGEIVLNVSHTATRHLKMDNEVVQFSARFNGVSREISVPVDRIVGIFARENGQGAFFPVEDAPPAAALPANAAADAEASAGETGEGGPAPSKPGKPGRPKLTVVK